MNKPDLKDWLHLHEMSGIGKFIEIECKLVVAKDWWEGGMGYSTNRYRVSFECN